MGPRTREHGDYNGPQRFPDRVWDIILSLSLAHFMCLHSPCDVCARCRNWDNPRQPCVPKDSPSACTLTYITLCAIVNHQQNFPNLKLQSLHFILFIFYPDENSIPFFFLLLHSLKIYLIKNNRYDICFFFFYIFSNIWTLNLKRIFFCDVKKYLNIQSVGIFVNLFSVKTC